jgi:toxin ParE1/3/4
MIYRLGRTAESQIDQILLESARKFGIEAANRYHRLILATMAAIAETPLRPGSRAVYRVPGVRVFPLRLARGLVEPEHRVVQPRHLILYRISEDGIVEVLGAVHDRMVLARTARRIRRETRG